MKPSYKSTAAFASFALKRGAAGGVPGAPGRGASCCPAARPRRTERKHPRFSFPPPRGGILTLPWLRSSGERARGRRRSAEQGAHGGGHGGDGVPGRLAQRCCRGLFPANTQPAAAAAVGVPGSTAAPRAAGSSSAGFLPALAFAIAQPRCPGTLRRPLTKHLLNKSNRLCLHLSCFSDFGDRCGFGFSIY